jgi:hypothetical protein
MAKLFALLAMVAAAAAADEISYLSLQSGPYSTTTPLYDHGLHGEGQIIAVLDTGVDYTSCYFVEPDGSRPPINTRLDQNNIDLTRRKIVAYDFLYSCDQYPGASGCDDPNNPNAYDNQGHGTHAAASAVGDSGTPIVHDYADGVATGAKLIVQDAGYIVGGGDNCTQRPGIGCPVNITPILDQAYRQGARIHSNSWGDAQGSPFAPPTANYPQSARDVDAFVYSHPDMLIVFNTGNFGSSGTAPASTVSAPGCAKNTLQVGGTRDLSRYADDVLARFTLMGPTRDGRTKPDVVGPAYVIAGDAQVITHGNSCGTTAQPGTSWSSPTIAGAAALVRQYFTDGYYPTGVATPSNGINPSAALLKATIIAAAQRVPSLATSTGLIDAKPVPSFEQGFGFPVLGNVLYFPGNAAKLRVVDAPGLAQGESATMQLSAKQGTPLKVVLVWTDPPGVPLVNDLDLRVEGPGGSIFYGNGQPDHVNNVEVVSIPQPLAGTYTVTVSASRIGLGPRQDYALVVSGDIADATPVRSRAVRH